MTASYYPYYVRLRMPLAEGFGYLADRGAFRRLVALGQAAPAEAFLVDAGDVGTEVVHAQAKHSQADDAYTRERLTAPRFTFFEEHANNTGDGHSLSDDPFLELVLGGSYGLVEWCQRHPGVAGLEVSVHSDPLEVHCHTPLNQRLHPTSMRICQWLDQAASELLETLPPGTASPLLAAGCFIQLIDTLCLDQNQRVALCAYGHKYLSQYLEYASTDFSDAVDRRVGQIARTAAILRKAVRPTRQGPGECVVDSGGLYFFPETLWMQLHWLASSLPVNLVQELALAEALLHWDGKSATT